MTGTLIEEKVEEKVAPIKAELASVKTELERVQEELACLRITWDGDATVRRVPCRAGYGLPDYRIRCRITGLPDGRISRLSGLAGLPD